MEGIFGRADEIQVLERALASSQSQFIAIYGRRRIGKTYLVREFFAQKEALFFNATGAKNGPRKEQISHFVKKLGEAFYGGVSLSIPKTWDEVFQLLTKAMETQPKDRKIVLFLDETPWLATQRSRFLENLDYYWNQYWSNDPRVKLIICGSSASWIIRKVINNKGGLHNRITQQIHLEPFTLLETKQYLDCLGIKLNNQQIALLYMVTGGVAYYLSLTEKGMSVMEMLEKQAFHKKGILHNEFKNLFSSLFDSPEDHVAVIRALSERPYGMGKNELLTLLGKSAMGAGGLATLEELEEADFIMGLMPFQHKRQGIYYRLVDEYSLFYLRWIEPLSKTLQKQNLTPENWRLIQQSTEWRSWLGYAFESLCYKHIALIRKALNISPMAIADTWRYVPKKGASDQGAQIDLLFDRPDGTITLCEIKYTEEPFVLTKEVVQALQRKMAVFQEKTKTKKQLFMAMISANGLKNNFYAEELVHKVVSLEDLFKT